MFEGLNLGNLAEAFSKVQEKAKELQEDAGAVTYTAKSGGGMISVSANGNGEVVDISIDDSLLSDKESLQILLISAINDAFKMVEDGKRDMAMKMMGNLGSFGKDS